MSFRLYIPEIRTIIAASMDNAWSLSDGQALLRTKYPDRLALDDVLDSQDAIDEEDGFNEIYRVITPGILAGSTEWGTCAGQTFMVPVKIYIARRVSDTPHDDGATMLERARDLADDLFLNAVWTTVPPKVNLHLVQMTTHFPEAEEFNAAHFAPVLLHLNIEFDTTM